MKKLVSFVCIFPLLIISVTLYADEVQTTDVGELTFGDAVRQDQISDLTEEEIMILEREVNGPIVSIGWNEVQSRMSVFPEGHVRATVAFSEEADHNGRMCLRCVAMVTWHVERSNNKNDFMLLSFGDESPFIIQPNSYDAYTYYNDPETGKYGFDYTRTAVGGIDSKCIWYQYDMGLQDIMLVIRTNIYSGNPAITSGSVTGSVKYYHAEKLFSLSDVSLSWPPALSFTSEDYRTTSGYSTYDY